SHYVAAKSTTLLSGHSNVLISPHFCEKTLLCHRNGSARGPIFLWPCAGNWLIQHYRALRSAGQRNELSDDGRRTVRSRPARDGEEFFDVRPERRVFESGAPTFGHQFRHPGGRSAAKESAEQSAVQFLHPGDDLRRDHQ